MGNECCGKSENSDVNDLRDQKSDQNKSPNSKRKQKP